MTTQKHKSHMTKKEIMSEANFARHRLQSFRYFALVNAVSIIIYEEAFMMCVLILNQLRITWTINFIIEGKIEPLKNGE